MNLKAIKKMTVSELFKYPEFKFRYVTLYNDAHMNTLDIDGENHFEREIGFLKQVIMDSTYISGATTLSFMTLLLDLAYNGLTLQPGSKPLAYVLPRSTKVKNADGNEIKEVRAILGVSPYGEVALRIRSGIIRYVDNPVMVYKGDYFQPDTKDGNTIINHSPRFESEEIIYSFVKITRYDESVEYKYFSLADMMKFKEKSDSKTGTAWTGGPNGGPLRGMWEAKTLKHAFNSYPRLRLGTSAEIAEFEPTRADSAYAAAMGSFTEDDEDDDSPLTPTPPPTEPKPTPPPTEPKPTPPPTEKTQVEIVPTPPPTDYNVPTYEF